MKCPSCNYEHNLGDYDKAEFNRLDFKVKIKIGEYPQKFDVDVYTYEDYRDIAVNLYVCPMCKTVIQS